MPTLRFNKPFEVLTQFTDAESRKTLADYIDMPGVYAAGRLDRDSEGLLLLTDDGALQHQIAHPDHKQTKTYWVQVDGDISDEAINQLCQGVMLKDGLTKPAQARRIDEPARLWPRNPPIRFRANIPTSWIELTIHEGKNRQVRRMTAAVGFPTLRLIRYAIGDITLDGLQPGAYEPLNEQQQQALLSSVKQSGRSHRSPIGNKAGRGVKPAHKHRRSGHRNTRYPKREVK